MIGCLVGLIAFFLPRVAIILLALFSDFIGRPFTGLLWPILGFFFAPYTLLTYCFAYVQNGGKVDGMWLIAVGIAVLFDLGVIGGGAKAGKKKRKD